MWCRTPASCAPVRQILRQGGGTRLSQRARDKVECAVDGCRFGGVRWAHRRTRNLDSRTGARDGLHAGRRVGEGDASSDGSLGSAGAGGSRGRMTFYVLGGLLLYGASVYVGATLYKIYTLPDLPAPPVLVSGTTADSAVVDGRRVLPGGSSTYDSIASRYDADINMDEFLMGLTHLRRRLFRSIGGDVLEVSAGTGRNLAAYDPSHLSKLVLVDASREMLDLARDKVEGDARWRESGVEVTFKDVPLEALSPLREQFDVVVQTFGLCSVSDPVSFLSHLSQFCRAGGKGEIILMEHGRSPYPWLNRLLDHSAEEHFERWGCRYNLDIQAIVESCKDVEIVSLKRWHFGTTYIYHLRPVMPS